MDPKPEQRLEEAKEKQIRVSQHGKMKSYIANALAFLEVRHLVFNSEFLLSCRRVKTTTMLSCYTPFQLFQRLARPPLLQRPHLWLLARFHGCYPL